MQRQEDHPVLLLLENSIVWVDSFRELTTVRFELVRKFSTLVLKLAAVVGCQNSNLKFLSFVS